MATMSKRTPTSYRLPEQAAADIRELAARLDISQADVIAEAVATLRRVLDYGEVAEVRRRRDAHGNPKDTDDRP
jgi:hypothetical protein